MCYWSFIHFHWRNVYLDIFPILNWFICLLLMIYKHIYILDISPLLKIRLQTFSLILGLSFQVVVMSVEAQRFLMLMKFTLFYLLLLALLVSYLRYNCLTQKFSSKSFIISALTFKFMTYIFI